MSYRDSEFFQRSFERAQRDYDNQMPPESRAGINDEEHDICAPEDTEREHEEAAGDAKFDLDR